VSAARHLPLVDVHGSAFDRGEQLGSQSGVRIREFLAQDMARINRVRAEPLSHEAALRYAARAAAVVDADLPEVAQEIRGLAAGARIGYGDAMILQCRRELIAVGDDGDCTTLAGFNDDAGTYIAQNVDLPGALEDLGLIVRHHPAEAGEPDVLMFTHVGLIGYLGLNSAGIAVGINVVRSEGWTAGVPPYLLVRQLLRRPTLAAALDDVGRVRRASSRCFLLSDGARIVDLEMTVDEHAVAEGDFHIHTNHFIIPELVPHDRLPPGGSSHARFDRAAVLVGGRTRLDEPELAAILRDHAGFPRSVCGHQKSTALGRTIASVMLFPAEGRLIATMGQPCSADYHTYWLSGRSAAHEATHA
jgi:isopenicillin-N N-acyltransferase-like protein